jgi:hypothetical protein
MDAWPLAAEPSFFASTLPSVGGLVSLEDSSLNKSSGFVLVWRMVQVEAPYELEKSWFHKHQP